MNTLYIIYYKPPNKPKKNTKKIYIKQKLKRKTGLIFSAPEIFERHEDEEKDIKVSTFGDFLLEPEKILK